MQSPPGGGSQKILRQIEHTKIQRPQPADDKSTQHGNQHPPAWGAPNAGASADPARKPSSNTAATPAAQKGPYIRPWTRPTPLQDTASPLSLHTSMGMAAADKGDAVHNGDVLVRRIGDPLTERSGSGFGGVRLRWMRSTCSARRLLRLLRRRHLLLLRLRLRGLRRRVHLPRRLCVCLCCLGPG